jgi:putative ABC transport system permease protein
MTRDELKENFLVAMDTLRARKGRSALTLLGVVIGVASVIAVAAIIHGLNRQVASRVEWFGSRVFLVSRLPFVQFGRLPEAIRLRKYFNYDDARVIRQQCRLCDHATAFAQRWVINPGRIGATQIEIKAGHEHVTNPFIRGVDPEYLEIFPMFAARDGRFISQFDLDHSRFVCALGDAVAGSLFPGLDPIGREVTMDGQHFEVIGVFEHDPGLFGMPGVDSFVVLPYSTFHKLYPEVRDHFIAVTVSDPTLIPQAEDEVTQILRRLRRVHPGAPNDFDMGTPDFLSDLWNQLTGALVLLTAVISSIGLLVGGIGVMNIMLISVTERTQEIGVRKAVGARRQDIRAQFLIEAITLTSFGGVLGILVGAAISGTVHAVVPSLPAEVSLLWVTMGFAISVSVGLFFGFYPANRAANLDPIVCLRYE